MIGLPGNPRSALVVFRLIGMPLIRLVGGCDAPPPEPSTRAVLSRDLASATGRLDVVQVKVSGGVATPLFGVSALLSVLTAGRRLHRDPRGGHRPGRRHRGHGDALRVVPQAESAVTTPARAHALHVGADYAGVLS